MGHSTMPTSFGAASIMALLAWGLSASTYAADAPHERVPRTLKASQILPKGMLRGEGFSVREKVTNDGFMNTYVVRSDYGESTVVGNDHLRARIQEIRATKAIEELASSQAFGDAAKGAVTGTAEGGKALRSGPKARWIGSPVAAWKDAAGRCGTTSSWRAQKTRPLR